jgi:hypothetical protein
MIPVLEHDVAVHATADLLRRADEAADELWGEDLMRLRRENPEILAMVLWWAEGVMPPMLAVGVAVFVLRLLRAQEEVDELKRMAA